MVTKTENDDENHLCMNFDNNNGTFTSSSSANDTDKNHNHHASVNVDHYFSSMSYYAALRSSWLALLSTSIVPVEWNNSFVTLARRYGYSPLSSTLTALLRIDEELQRGNTPDVVNMGVDTIPYNLTLSTEQNYKTKSKIFYGNFTSIRSTLDYTYHSNYIASRQKLQDSILSTLLQQKSNNSSTTTTYVPNNPSSAINEKEECRTVLQPKPPVPWIVFTAGAMGAGKSYTIRHLASKHRFPLDSFLTVDPDEIRRLLPEFDLYLSDDQLANMAGEFTGKEAGLIAEILTEVGLREGRNVLVDGSLKDSDWYMDYFERLRREYGSSGSRLKIGILHITAPRDAVFDRAENRSKITKRIVPREKLEESLEIVPQSVQRLAPLADFFAELHNAPHSSDVELVASTEGLDWDSFRTVWSQDCTDNHEAMSHTIRNGQNAFDDDLRQRSRL